MKNLLTAQQVADYLGVKLSTIRKWCHYGFIPKVKLGGAVRFDPDAIDVWIEKRSSDGRPKMKMSAYESKARRSAQRLITLRTD